MAVDIPARVNRNLYSVRESDIELQKRAEEGHVAIPRDLAKGGIPLSTGAFRTYLVLLSCLDDGYPGMGFLCKVTGHSENTVRSYMCELVETGLLTKRGSAPKRGVSSEVARQVFERDDYRCVRCGDRFRITVDHIHPLSKGGSSEIENLQTLCVSCNSRKGAKI